MSDNALHILDIVYLGDTFRNRRRQVYAYQEINVLHSALGILNQHSCCSCLGELRNAFFSLYVSDPCNSLANRLAYRNIHYPSIEVKPYG